MKVDYQVKQDELIKEQVFLNQYGIHKEIPVPEEKLTDQEKER